jgi:hypothetical protein
MKDDEDLGLYNEPFKHKVETIPTEEILANRSNAYEFIDFDKQEILHEVALEFAKDHYEMYETSNLGSMHFGFIEGAKWQQEQDKKCYHPLPYRLAKSDVNYECTLCGKFI